MTLKTEDMIAMWPSGSEVGLVKQNNALLVCTIIKYAGDKVVVKDCDEKEHFIFPHNIKYVISKGVVHIAIQRD